MNYRHAYHAGNFADCMKHALFIWLLQAMQRKPAPFMVLDTHAGIGRYDLTTGPATKTAEWRDGIGRLLKARPGVLSDYLALIDVLGLYPGSPAIVAEMLREADRLIACELHPDDAATLKTAFYGIKQISIHARDGYTALRAFLPPLENRSLILVDPPFERPDEFAVLAENLKTSWLKCRNGVYAVWYPIKHRAPVRSFFEHLASTGIRDMVAAEFWRRPPTDPARLNGCGMLIINPPFGFESAALPMLKALVDVLGEAGSGCAVERLIDE